jgi:hypothetical protein
MARSGSERVRAHRDRKRLKNAEGRAAAVAHGRMLGTAEAIGRRESPEDTELRVRRAMAYAAWEYDGSPEDFSPYRVEFGVSRPSLLDSLLR